MANQPQASQLASRLGRWLISVALFGALLFGLAGRRDLPMLWALWGVCAVLALAVILTIDQELAQERRRPGPGGVDRRRRLLFALLFVSTLALASLDVGRLHWSDTVPLGIQVTALGVAAGAMGVLVWAVAVNRFFSPVVRIQTERGHHLVDRGPYRWVRHPGYLGMFLALPASALALGSWWALMPAVANSLMVLRRLALEDRYLGEHLAGYGDYVKTVKYRLVPGVW